MAVTHYAHWICEIKMDGWLVLSRYNWLWTNLTCASDMLFDGEPALIMASVSSLPGWRELDMIHLPWGLLSAQRFFSTYLVVDHAAVTLSTTRHFPLTSVAHSVWDCSLWALETVVSVWKSQSISGLWNIHFNQLPAPFWGLVWPPAGHLHHVLVCPSLWMFVLICRCTQLTWINNYSHCTIKTWAEWIESHWRLIVFLLVCDTKLLNDVLGYSGGLSKSSAK